MGGLKPGRSAYQLIENTFLAQVLRNAKYIGAPATIFTQRDKSKADRNIYRNSNAFCSTTRVQ